MTVVELILELSKLNPKWKVMCPKLDYLFPEREEIEQLAIDQLGEGEPVVLING